MEGNKCQKLFKGVIATVLVASTLVAVPTMEVNAHKDSGKDYYKHDHKKDNKNGHKKGKDKKEPKVNKTALQTYINSIKKLKKSDYTIASWNKFQQSLAAAQRILWRSNVKQTDVTKALNNLKSAFSNLVLVQQTTEMKVNTFNELKTAINNPKIKIITIQKDIKLTQTLKITTEKHINGNGYTLTGFTSNKGDGYALHYTKTVGSISNLKIKGANAALYVDSSKITLSSLIDVSGNTGAGIKISDSLGTKNLSQVNIKNATLVNRDEANHKPTILEERIEHKDVALKVVGYERLYVDYNQKATNHLQRFYYINRNLKAPNPINHFTLSLMHSNDTHGVLNQIAKKVTAVKEVRKAKPKALLIDAGDVFSGSTYFNKYKGQAELAFMNLMGYDMMTFGHQEFNLGSSREGHQALANFIKGAQFSFVSSNIDFSKDAKLKGLFTNSISSNPGKGKIYNGVVKQVDGEKVGFFGLTTEETRNSSNPGSIVFKNYVEEAKKAVAAFEKMGVNKIVAVTHNGFNHDMSLASVVEGIDVIIGGHSHTQLAQPIVVDPNGTPTIIVQAYQNDEYLGTLDVAFDHKGLIVRHDGKLIKIADKTEDWQAAMLLRGYTAGVN